MKTVTPEEYKRLQRAGKREDKSIQFAEWLRAYLPGVEIQTEHMFHSSRKWRLDIAIPSRKIAVEIEGGVFKKGGGGHNRGPGYDEDCQKYNAAVLDGWRLLRFTTRRWDNRRWRTMALAQVAAMVQDKEEPGWGCPP